MAIKVGRLYDEPEDGSTRVLVDRLWPRGVRKDDPRIGEWWPDIAPSNDLRKWYGHEPSRFAEFTRRYEAELDTDEGRDGLKRLKALARKQPVTLITASKHLDESHLVALTHMLGIKPKFPTT